MKKNLYLKAVYATLTYLLSLVALVPECYAQTIRQAAGLSAADIQSTVDAFRADLGGVNNGGNDPATSGRREISWDGVSDELAAPNNLPANFFNINSKRGVVFATPGSGFQVSAQTNNPTATAVEFGNLSPAFANLFRAFSPERLFTPVGSNITNVAFFVPGTATPALVQGFGAVFTDVERNDSTKLEFFDLQGNLIYSGFAPAVPGAHESFSFLGASFAAPQIALVRITSGNAALDAQAENNDANDLVAMDDFIYGEPQAVTQYLGCGSMICFAEPRFWAAQLRRPFSPIGRGVVKIPGVNKTLPINIYHPTVLIALSPPLHLAVQPRTQLVASYVAAQISAQSHLTGGGFTGGSSTLGCYGVNAPVALSTGAVIGPFTTINQLLAATDNVFLQNQSGDIEKLLQIYQRLQATCNL
jgi:hypothetical protein